MSAPLPFLIGRAALVRRCRAARRDGAAIITLVGPVGVGKTRLAAALATDAERVWWIEPDGQPISTAIARAVDASPIGLTRALATLPPGLLVLDGLDLDATGDPETITRLVTAGPHLDWLITRRVPLAMDDEHVVPVEPLSTADALRLYRAIAGAAEPAAAALVDRLGRLPAAVIRAARRSPIIGAAAQLERLRTWRPSDGSALAAHVAAEWDRLDPSLRIVWLACALTAGVTPLGLVEQIGGTVDGVVTLRERGLVDTEQGPSGTRLMVPEPLAVAAATVADAATMRATAQAVADAILPRLSSWRRDYGGRTGPEAAARLTEWTPAVRRLADRTDPTRAARLLGCLQPLRIVADGPSDPDPVLEAAVRAAVASGVPELVVDALVGHARHAFMHGAFGRADAILAAPALAAADDWALSLARGHCALRTGHWSVAAEHLDRAATQAPDPDTRLQVEIQVALGLHLRGHTLDALGRLGEIARRADAIDARRTAAVARWHLGSASIEGADALAGVAALRRAVETMEALGERGCRVVSHGVIARGLRRAGLLDEADTEARRGHEMARRCGLPEAELDCAIERLWLAVDRGTPADVLRGRLALLAVMPETRRPRATARAEAALSAAASMGSTLLVADDGAWLRTADGHIVDLRRRRAAWRVLARLAQARRVEPGRSLDVHTLFAAGWPETEINPHSQARRVYTAIWQLRDLGLGDGLVHDDGGYRLADAVQIAAHRPTDRRAPAVSIGA